MTLQPVMNVDELNRFLDTDFPQVHTDGKVFSVTETGPGFATMRLDPNERHIRPGGTVSGPTLFALADVSAYIALIAHIGPVALPSPPASTSTSCASRNRNHSNVPAGFSSSANGWPFSTPR